VDVLGRFGVATGKGLHHLMQPLANTISHCSNSPVTAQAQRRKRQGIFAAEHIKLLAHVNPLNEVQIKILRLIRQKVCRLDQLSPG
jgi:hypothetical protein